jgi:hypothetical protein
MLLSSLEAAELLPSEADAQKELGLDSEDAATEEDTSGEDVFGFEDAQHWVGRAAAAVSQPCPFMLPSLPFVLFPATALPTANLADCIAARVPALPPLACTTAGGRRGWHG